MIVRASGRSGLIIAAGFLLCFAGPSPSAAGADDAAASPKSETAKAPARHASHHWRGYAHRKSGKVELKSSDSKKAASPEVAAADRGKSPTLTPSVANANAQLTANDTKAMPAQVNDNVQAAPEPAASTQVVAPDQVNDVDRALRENTPPPTTLAMASAGAPPRIAQPVTAGNNENSTWDQASLIGKIFIGFGALLTMASAARMFMA
jgi:hypothetical protein